MADLSTADICLIAAGLLAALVAIGHGLTAELHVFRKAVVQPESLRTLIRLVWQASTVAWLVLAGVLMATPWLVAGSGRRVVIVAAIAVYAYGGLGNLIATRGRHPGWGAMLIVVGLCYAGR